MPLPLRWGGGLHPGAASLKIFMRINTQKEEEDAEHGLGHLQELTVRPISVEIRNEAIDGKRIRDVKPLLNRAFVISRIRHTGSQETELANADTVLHMQDEILFIANPKDVEAIVAFFGRKNFGGVGTGGQELDFTPHPHHQAGTERQVSVSAQDT